MASTSNENPDLSPISPTDEDSDVMFPTVAETEPEPGLNGVPVRCMSQEQGPTTCKPHTLTPYASM